VKSINQRETQHFNQSSKIKITKSLIPNKYEFVSISQRSSYSVRNSSEFRSSSIPGNSFQICAQVFLIQDILSFLVNFVERSPISHFLM
jgi:hypothetical protein